MEKVRQYLFLLFLIAGMFCSCPSSAKMGDEHYEDMLDIFPFLQDSRNQKVIDLYYTINSYLDEPNWEEDYYKRPAFVCNDYFFKDLSWGNHRIWFHWGLSDPRYPSHSLAKTFSPLQRVVNDKLMLQKDRGRFWDALYLEEHSRLQTIWNKAVIAFGYDPASIYDLQREQIWAFATVLYSIHILGDLTTKEYKIVRSEEDVRKDIYSAIRTIGGYKNKRIAEELISFLEIEAPISSAAKGTTSASAQKLLTALKDKKKGFSQFVLSCRGFGYNYTERFKESLLVVKE